MKSSASFLKHASDVSAFYGFRPIREIEKETPPRAGGLPRRRTLLHTFMSAAQVCAVRAAAPPGEPVLAFYATPTPEHAPFPLPARETGEFGLQVVGSGESMGEVLLLKTLAMIAQEWGVKPHAVRLNALGDRDSQQRFMRELAMYVRKQADRLDPSYRDEVIKNPLTLYYHRDESCLAIMAEAPRPTHFLSEKSRLHFRSVLEHVEHLGLSYELDNTLVGDDRGAHTLFALDFGADETTILACMGGRYDEYLRRETRQKESAGVCASIYFRKSGLKPNIYATERRAHKPKIYFAQLGARAKLQGLAVIDMLRVARVPAWQSFNTTHLSVQLAAAREKGVSHLLIMGQREAIDGTIIVRSMQNSSQMTLTLTEIPRFLKSLR
ncbi:MAG: His/Gly/Thr/Pro-type tRNA ligase C-terminal domain-containing protein [Patescibacteria group bacterium]|nr:His/Gly/Thr/Pro-type tRNA ligase C-terminal domain-containing protein [Patescibacteria group bacterium]